MAHLWVKDGDGAWSVLPLSGELVDLTAGLATTTPQGPAPAASGVALCSSGPPDGAGATTTWALLAGREASVRVNGTPMLSGIRVLSDRDEIRLDGESVFFSTERLARVESYPGADREVFCPRCRQAVEPGDDAVRCPDCSVWHHEHPDLPCWSYASTCALCPRSTDLDAGFRWVPEEE